MPKKLAVKFENMFKEGPLREAMIIYLSTMYEDEADFSEYNMMREYAYLRDNCLLHQIFEAVEQHNNLHGEA